ncbi:hemolysin III family protein [Actinotalea sp.]|mgnify:CR=1 FL=1|uniref:PAQR family membrane homeostasis protein TrhA n=1 Tax=Actinotalea sp. TaxID=1872145 RepID=UPI002C91ED08|nr:hemolysin III family protein [Actinotalea sp.]HQY34369.1 hemolysin III family protein [Actinotalea sp.]HRA50335.1 hemolysin III family protein [Actinotalea sp.]
MADNLIDAVKPRLRGWLHAGMAPLALVGAIALVALAPTTAGKVTTAIFGLSSILLFGVSAVYHRGTWSPRVNGVLRRLDHTNIFLIIAGTYTPLAVLLLPRETAQMMLVVVWSGALAGLLARIFWLGAPRWFYTPVYVALGWVAVWYIPTFWVATPQGPTIVWLVAAGGLAYTLGAVVYGTRWPDPSPRWFGFHEVFHSLTVVGFVCHYVAVSIAVYTAG